MRKLFYVLMLLCLPLTAAAGQTDIEKAEAAIKNNDVRTLEQLIQNGMDLNSYDAKGRPLVYFALINSSWSSLRLLADNGADMNAPVAKTGETPLIYAVSAAERVQKEIENLYLNEMTPEQQVQKAEEIKETVTAEMKRAAQTVRILIDLGADTNQETPFGTPLNKAASNSMNTDIVKILLDSGADVNQPDQNGRTALFYAEANGCADISLQLIAAGGDVYHKDASGKTYIEIDKEDLLRDEIIHDM